MPVQNNPTGCGVLSHWEQSPIDSSRTGGEVLFLSSSSWLYTVLNYTILVESTEDEDFRHPSGHLS
jgi:hypothetical protein